MKVKLTPQQAAKYLGFKDSTLAKWRCNGLGPKFTKIGGRIFYWQEELDTWLTSHAACSSTAQARVLKEMSLGDN